MALHSQVWPPATPMPMAESSLYRQRLEVIAEKRRLQEEIRAARRELEEEKLRVERLKRKSLRERWLMDGAAEGPEPLEDPASKDPQSPEGQARARIRNLEDSLFTLQSQLQLLQSACTGAQHRPAGRPTWRRQGPRPLSQPTLETDPAGHTDVDKRASLPAGPVSISPESFSESKEQDGVLPALRPLPGDMGASSDANSPCPGHSPLTGQEPSLEAVAAVGVGILKAKGKDMVEVVWEGLRPTEDCAIAPTGPELEAKVEEVVLESLGARRGTGSMEFPAWVKEDRGVVEVVWEGLGGSDSADSQTGSQGLQEQFKAEDSRKEEGVLRDRVEGDGHRGSEGEERSFIWVERVNLSEDWEELLMEGLEGPTEAGKEGEAEAQPGAEQSWEVQRREAETSEEMGEKGREPKPGAERDRVEVLMEEGRRGSRASLEPERTEGETNGIRQEEGKERKAGEGLVPERETDQEKWEVEEKEDEQLEVEKGGEENPEATEELLVAGEKHTGSLDGVRKESEKLLDGETESEGSLETERKGYEELLNRETEGEGSLAGETKQSEKLLDGETEGSKLLNGETKESEKLLDRETEGQESLGGETKQSEKLLDRETEGSKLLDGETEGEGSLGGETKQSEKPLDGEGEGEGSLAGDTKGDEGPSEKIHGTQREASPEEQRALGEGAESQASDVNKAGSPQEEKPEPLPEAQGLQGQEKQKGSVEVGRGKAQPLAEGQGLREDATPFLAESQPLLQREGASANPSAHPVPTYAPARQPEPTSRTEGEEASGPKQKTCQCCAVM